MKKGNHWCGGERSPCGTSSPSPACGCLLFSASYRSPRSSSTTGSCCLGALPHARSKNMEPCEHELNVQRPWAQINLSSLVYVRHSVQATRKVQPCWESREKNFSVLPKSQADSKMCKAENYAKTGVHILLISQCIFHYDNMECVSHEGNRKSVSIIIELTQH